MDYKSSGVDIAAGDETVRRIRSLARSTFTPGVLSDIGSFGGLFRLDATRYREPVLVSSADGVGTKLKVAFLAAKHEGIGTDLVNHCVNDILVQGAEPLFFLDYFATGRLSPGVAAEVVGGVARGCRENGCALIGGETAEMPGFYADGEYDLAGFIVGIVDRDAVIDGRGLRAGDHLIGLPSNGLHTNGYSLARRIVFDKLKLSVDSVVAELGETIGAVLLRTHRSYLKAVKPLADRRFIKGMAHITGGGIPGNLSRILPEGAAARVARPAWPTPAVFQFLQDAGKVPPDEMFCAFNMGIGLILACAAEHGDEVRAALTAAGETSYLIGEITSGDRTVSLD
jgi:phosphoribosylformylglycinamidine cyclo-ligase